MNITPINSQYSKYTYTRTQTRTATFKAGQNYQTLYTELEKMAKDIEQKQNQKQAPIKEKTKKTILQWLHKLVNWRKNDIAAPTENLAADKNGWTELHYFCRDGYTDAVKNLLNNHPNLNINQLTKDGRSYVEIANNNCRVDIVNMLVSMKNYNPEVKGIYGRTDLHHLCYSGRLKAVKTILKNHPDINLNQLADGWSYMRIAVNNSNYKLIELLANMKNYNPTIKGENGWTDLHYLCAGGYTKAVKTLLKKHPDIDISQLTDSGTSYVKLASNHYYEDIVNMLVGMKNYNPEVQDEYGWTDLHYLCKNGCADAVKTIFKRFPNINMNQLSKGGDSYIAVAKRFGHENIVNILAQYI